MSQDRSSGHVGKSHMVDAAIEIVAVVLGVFIGMQVSNWNEQRQIDQQAAEFTLHLKEDLNDEDWRCRFLIAYTEEVLKNATLAVGALEGARPLSDEALLVSAYRATQYMQGQRRRSTYDELISTGKIGLIRDRTLRDTAMRLYSIEIFDEMNREGMESSYRAAFRRTLPNDVQNALGRQCGDREIHPGDYESLHGVLDYPCSTGLSEQVIADSVKALRSNPEIRPLLRQRVADIGTRLGQLTSNYKVLLDKLDAIAKETRRS